MKKISMLICALVAASAFAVEAPKVSVGANWHAQDTSKGLITMNRPYLDYQVNTSWYGAFINAKFKQDVSTWKDDNGSYTRDTRNKVNEIDWYLGYKYTFNDLWAVAPITLTAQFEYDQYPHSVGSVYRDFDGVNEMFYYQGGSKRGRLYSINAAIGDVLSADAHSLSFNTTLIYEMGAYAFRGDATAAYSYKLNDKITLGTSAAFFWRSGKSNDAFSYYNRINGVSVNTVEIRPTVSYAVTDKLSVNAYAMIATAMNEKARKAQMDSDPLNMNHQWNFDAGIGLSYKF